MSYARICAVLNSHYETVVSGVGAAMNISILEDRKADHPSIFTIDTVAYPLHNSNKIKLNGCNTIPSESYYQSDLRKILETTTNPLLGFYRKDAICSEDKLVVGDLIVFESKINHRAIVLSKIKAVRSSKLMCNLFGKFSYEHINLPANINKKIKLDANHQLLNIYKLTKLEAKTILK